MQIEPVGRMISVFGGSQSLPDSPEYREAHQIGRLLAESGYTVCTGGYQGTMAAASRGAFDAGGVVVGITMSQLTSRVNDYVTQTHHTADFYSRLQRLIEDSDAFIVVRGGVGTLVEVTLVWNMLTTRILSPRPLILVGRDVWLPWLDACQATLAVGPELIGHLQLVDTAAEAVAAVVGAKPLEVAGAKP
jgi:uncharacterized protein (TIGR00730 family)